MRLQAYALGTYARPQAFTAGLSPSAVGGTAGANLNIFHFGRFQPSLDARVTGVAGDTSQLFLGGGPRVTADFGRVHPYVDFLAGYGTMSFKNLSDPTYTHNNSTVTAFGGGVDFSINRAWAIRADVQRQSWQITTAMPAFYPVTVGVGVRYQFHFKSRNGPE